MSDIPYFETFLNDRIQGRLIQAMPEWVFFNRFRARKITFTICERLPGNDDANVFSAYSENTEKQDNIYVTQHYVGIMKTMLADVVDSQSRYSFMLHVLLLFTAMHEFAHVVYGHCAFRLEKLSTFRELAHHDSCLVPKDLQSMEYQADIWAAQEVALFLGECIHNRLWHDAYQNYSDMLLDSFAAFSYMFILYEDYEKANTFIEIRMVCPRLLCQNES